MSSKTKKPRRAAPKEPEAKQKKSEPVAAAAAQPKKDQVARPKGIAPRPMVSSRHSGEMVERQARGFSVGELEGAGFKAPIAGRWGLPIDIRRRSVLDRNVQALKRWFVPAQEAPKERPASPEPEEKPKKAAARPKKQPARKKVK